MLRAIAMFSLLTAFVALAEPDGGTAVHDQGHREKVAPAGSGRTQTCAAASDCHGMLPKNCRQCSDGKTRCAHFACVDRKCEAETCPSAASSGGQLREGAECGGVSTDGEPKVCGPGLECEHAAGDITFPGKCVKTSR